MISFPNFIQITVNPVLGIYKDAFYRRKCCPLNYQTCMDEKAERVRQESFVVCLTYVPAKTEAHATFSRAKFRSGYGNTTTISGLNIMKVRSACAENKMQLFEHLSCFLVQLL
jgi:hypothetical protein